MRASALLKCKHALSLGTIVSDCDKVISHWHAIARDLTKCCKWILVVVARCIERTNSEDQEDRGKKTG